MQNHKLLHNSSIIMSRTIIDKLSSNLILTLTSKSLQYAILWEKPQACREGGGCTRTRPWEFADCIVHSNPNNS